MKGLVYVSAAVLLLVAWDGFGVHGELMDYMISFRAEAPSSTLVSVKELPDGNFALVTTSEGRSICEYRRYDRNTQVLSKARLLEGGCENVAWGEDGSFVTKGFPCNYGLPCPRAYSFQREFPNKGDLTDFIADYVRKYDSSGLFLWRAPFVLHEDEYHEGSLAVLSDGSVVADNDYPVKYSPSGKSLWENQEAVPKNYGITRGGGIVEVENRNVLVTTNEYYNSVSLHKIAPRGRKVWTKVMRMGCPADTYLSPVLSTDGSYYAGCTTGFGDRIDGKITQGDYRVYKVSPTSKLLWVKTVKASGNEHLHTILPEDDGGVLLIGTSDSGKGQDKMAEGRGPWFVKLDARGRIEWDFVGEGLITAKSRHGYLFRASNPLMFAELVINQPRTSKELLSGNVIAIKSEENNRYIRTSSRIYANGKSVTPSSQWMVLRDKTEDSAFALRSVQSGKVASLVEVRPSDVLLKATTSSLRPRSKRDRFNIRHLGRGSVALLSDYEKYGYLRPNLKNGRIVATPSKQSDRKMRITRLHSGHPLIGSEVVLRLSSKNVLLEATAAGTVRARTKGLPLDRNRFVFKVATIPIVAYHDDVTLLGTPENLAQGLTHIEEIARGVGLVVEPTKCSFLRPRDVPLASLPSRLRLIGEREGLEHHGVGLGSANFVEDSCERVLARHKKLTDAIERLPESMLQSACLLSRFCAGPRLNYWLRSLPPRWGEWIAVKADAMQLKHWGTLLDEPLDLESAPDRDLIRAQLALPLRLGGFGVADRGLVCSPAVVASWATALRTLVSFRMRSACLLARALTSDDPVTLPPPLLSIYDGLQQAFSKCNAVPDENRSRFRSWKELLWGRAEASEDSPIDRVLADEGGANPGSPVADYPGLSRLWSSRTDVIQHSLTWGQHSAAHAILLNSPLTPPTTAARLRGMGSHLSHLWLTTLPSSLGHRLDAFQFRSAARIYLGLAWVGSCPIKLTFTTSSVEL